MNLNSTGLVLVTGAAGFIGKSIVYHLLDQGFGVVALLHRSRPDDLLTLEREGRIRIVTASVSDFDALSEAVEEIPLSAIVHCASRTTDVGRDWRFKESILDGTKNIVTLVEQNSIPRLVYFSTLDVYGLKDFEDADEQTPLATKTSNPYIKYKVIADKLVRNRLVKQAVILRPGTVWGPGDSTLAPRIIDFLKSSPWIIHFGRWRGKNRWPAVHVNTLCHTVCVALTANPALGQAFNVLDPECITIDGFYRKILQEYLPEKVNMRSVTLPFWVGGLIGIVSTLLSNLLDRSKPITDPTWFGLHLISKNLDFSSKKLNTFLEKEKPPNP